MTTKKISPSKTTTKRVCGNKKQTKAKAKALHPNPFKGADDVYLTKNKIAVVRVNSKRTERGYEQTKKVKYYTQNPNNIKQLKEVHGSTIAVGPTGNRYRQI